MARRERLRAPPGGTASGGRVSQPASFSLWLGRSRELCDVIVPRPGVSQCHCEVFVDPEDGTWKVRDLESTNGTALLVEGRRLIVPADRPAELRSGILLQLGADTAVLVNASLVRAVEDARHRRSGPVECYPEGRVAAGEDILERMVVRLAEEAGPEPVPASSATPGAADPATAGVTIRCIGAGLEVRTGWRKRRTLLHQLDLVIRPGTLTGLMGLSGSGKTALLRMLSGTVPPTSGEVRHACPHGMPVVRGVVPQADDLPELLTVREHLLSTARLRLPPGTKDTLVAERVAECLDRLELETMAEQRIGDPHGGGLSGGQRRRVQLAGELLTRPRVLLLDEPTSGLSSADAMEIFRLLRDIAGTGTTILVSLHQPSRDLYRQLDDIVLLFEGRLVHAGRAWPDAVRVVTDATAGDTGSLHPDAMIEALAEVRRSALRQAAPEDALEREAHRLATRFEAWRRARQGEVPMPAHQDAPDVAGSAPSTAPFRSAIERTATLMARRGLELVRDRATVLTVLLQAPAVAIILVLLFRRFLGPVDDVVVRTGQANGLLFLMAVVSIWFGCSLSARELVAERPWWQHERLAGLGAGPYLGSRVLLITGLCALQCLVLLGGVRFGLGLEGPWTGQWLTLLLCSVAGAAMGLFISSLVRRPATALSLVPLVLIPQIALGGFLFPGWTQPRVVQVAGDLTVARWGYEALLRIERGHEDLAWFASACGLYDAAPNACVVSYGDPPCVFRQAGVTQCALPTGSALMDNPLLALSCLNLCDRLRDGEPVTTLESAFGADSADPMRQRISAALGEGGDAPEVGASPQHPRSSVLRIWGLLAAGTLVLLLGTFLAVAGRDRWWTRVRSRALAALGRRADPEHP
ncbi:MAG: ATP-binding cassette domain-containing protein [Deltaproteobacteria bacterium]|nr:MAG: ATP-binding cassette domain-containing protein [Deltaproteobacteria bacterium]